MEKLKRIGIYILDFIEIVMPTLALIVIFGSFVVNVFCRYVLNSPNNSCYELALGGLVWCLLLSAPYAVRKHNNVCFTLIYDKLGAVGQMVFRLAGNAFLIFCLMVMLYPCTDWVLFMGKKHTPVLGIGMDVLYSPFIVFNVLSLAHEVYFFVIDIRKTVRAVMGKEPLSTEHHSMVTEDGGDEV